MDRIVAILGPTAGGKSELAVRLAQAIDGEVTMLGPVISITAILHRLEDEGYSVTADIDARGIQVTAVDPVTNETFTVVGEPGDEQRVLQELLGMIQLEPEQWNGDP